MYSLDTQEATMDDQTIRGYNLRLGARTWTDTTIGKASAFVNVSRNVNEILDPTTSKYRLPDLFHSYTVSAGCDLDYYKKNGVGFEYAMVDTREPDQHDAPALLQPRHDLLDRGLARDRRARRGLRAADQRRSDDDRQSLAVHDRAPGPGLDAAEQALEMRIVRDEVRHDLAKLGAVGRI